MSATTIPTPRQLQQKTTPTELDCAVRQLTELLVSALRHSWNGRDRLEVPTTLKDIPNQALATVVRRFALCGWSLYATEIEGTDAEAYLLIVSPYPTEDLFMSEPIPTPQQLRLDIEVQQLRTVEDLTTHLTRRLRESFDGTSPVVVHVDDFPSTVVLNLLIERFRKRGWHLAYKDETSELCLHPL